MQNSLMKEKVAVVIPTYKEKLSEYERVSLKQCTKILGQYDIYLIGASKFNHFESYREVCNVDLRIEKFNDTFFNNIQGYNQLMMSEELYQRFSRYKFILIYQLDCYVFRDELNYWCDKDYDYIGAPWIDANVYAWLYIRKYPILFRYYHKIMFRGKTLSSVGNGGLSLRKVSTMLLFSKLLKKTIVNFRGNEDSFFCHFVKTLFPFFKIPKASEALKFSFDVYPDKCFELNGNQIPFGCHAWCRNDDVYGDNLSFWENHIPKIKQYN